MTVVTAIPTGNKLCDELVIDAVAPSGDVEEQVDLLHILHKATSYVGWLCCSLVYLHYLSILHPYNNLHLFNIVLALLDRGGTHKVCLEKADTKQDLWRAIHGVVYL